MLRVWFRILCLFGMPWLYLACASSPPITPTPTQLEDTRLQAVALRADFYCPEEWLAAEMMLRQALEHQQAGRSEQAAASMHFALSMYQSAALCAARKRQEERMPYPTPHIAPGPLAP